jgi:N-acyl-L-homoserine lactone synthetase
MIIYCHATNHEKVMCYALRHKIYCQQFGFERCNFYHSESDEFDRDAVHFIAKIPTSYNPVIATVRLIVADKLQINKLARVKTPRDSAEISRFCVRYDYKGEINNIIANFVSLVKEEVIRREIKSVYMLTRKAIKKVLSRYNLQCEEVGEPVPYNGHFRIPYKISEVSHE